MTLALLAVFVFAAAMLQTITGFGFALIVMPLAVLLVGIKTAAPTVALVALTLYSVNLYRYRQSIAWSELKRLGLLAAAGVPFGIWILSNVDEQIVTRGLGILLVIYALYVLLRPTALHPISRRWAYPAGFVAGCLGGAYNTPGPPLILYGQMRQWPHPRFRAVLQAVFFVNALIVVAAHGVARNLNADVFRGYLIAAPFLLLGVAVAARLDRRIPADRVRSLVLVLILVLGLSLLL